MESCLHGGNERGIKTVSVMGKKKIAIFCGGPSSEHEVSILSAKKIFEFIDKEKYELYFFYITKDLNVNFQRANQNFEFENVSKIIPFNDALQEIVKQKIFALLAGIHGEFVEDGKLQEILDEHEIRYSGSNSFSSSLCMDKAKSMEIVNSIKIMTPPTHLLELPNDLDKEIKQTYPAIIKPNNMGSSVGVSIIQNEKDLKENLKELFDLLSVSKVLLQDFIHGIELSCGCLEKKDGTFIKLPPIEIHPVHGDLFDYKSKYVPGESNDITPPKSIDTKISDKISDITTHIHKALGCKTYSRSDFLVKDNDIFYLETNTLPGMTSTSLLPLEAAAVGISFSDLLDFIIINS